MLVILRSYPASGILGFAVAIQMAIVPARADDSCRPVLITEVPALFTPAGTLIDVTVNGTPVRFLLNLASTGSIVSTRLALRLGLSINDTHALSYSISGSHLAKTGFIEDLGVGGVPLRKGQKLLIADGLGDGTDGGPAGLLGYDEQRPYDVETDPAAGKVRLYEHSECSEKIGRWAGQPQKLAIDLDRHFMEWQTHVNIDGHRLTALFVSNNLDMLVGGEIARTDLGLDMTRTSATPLFAAEDPDGERIGFGFRTVKEIALGDVTFENPRIDVIEFARPSGLHGYAYESVKVTQVQIGASILNQLHVVYAFRNSAVYLEKVGSLPADPALVKAAHWPGSPVLGTIERGPG